MSFFSPAYTPESTATILNGQPNDATPVKDGFDTLNTFTGIIDDQRALTEQTSGPINLVANRDIYVPVNCAGGAVTVNLPSGVNVTTQPITIHKVGGDYNAVTIGLQNASDRIDSPWLSVSSPTLTSITLRFPGQRITLFPILKSGVYNYRVLDSNEAELYYLTRADVFKASGSQTLTANVTANSAMDTVTAGSNRFGFYNTTTYRYTPTIAGEYAVYGGAVFNAGSSANLILEVHKNGVVAKRLGQTVATADYTHGAGGMPLMANGSTDYFTIALTALTNTRTTTSGSAYQFGSFQLVARTA
jgi:hypothetical protein